MSEKVKFKFSSSLKNIGIKTVFYEADKVDGMKISCYNFVNVRENNFSGWNFSG